MGEMNVKRGLVTSRDDGIPRMTFPDYHRGERRADAVVHGVGCVLSVIAALWLLVLAPLSEASARGPLAVYAIAIIGMLASSAAYNLIPPSPTKAWLRRVDHALIFAAIAGTYTPLLLLRMPVGIGIPLCLAVWLLALAGAGLKMAAPGRYERLGLAFYLGLGWIGLPAVPILLETLRPATLELILAGGALYTIGAGVQLLTRLRYHNVAWHILVLAAACCHFLAMVQEFAPAPSG